MTLTPDQQSAVDAMIAKGELVTPEVLARIAGSAQEVNDKALESPQDIVDAFFSRYQQLSRIVMENTQLEGLTSINNLPVGKRASLIGLVRECQHTKNGHLLMVLEDPTGEIKALFSKSSGKLLEQAGTVLLDSCIGVVGDCDREIVYARELYFPGVPAGHPKKDSKGKPIVFISDLHYGNKLFYAKEFDAFIDWVNTQDIAHLFIAGDIIEGIGVYPGQESDLAITGIDEQYEGVARLLSKIRHPITLCSGNHDAVRLAEPQPAQHHPALDALSHVTSAPSPSRFQIGTLQIMLYHGNSFPYVADTVEHIRQRGGIKKADLIMRLLLKLRHLNPTFGSIPYIPQDPDPLLIDTIPDILATGHLHVAVSHQYGKTTCLNCSTWVGTSDYQRQRGIEPDPCKAFIIDPVTREVSIKSFSGASPQKIA